MMAKDQPKPSLRSGWILTSLVTAGVLLGCLFIACLVLHSQPVTNRAGDTLSMVETLRPVSVRRLTTDIYAARIQALADVVPLWKTTLKSQVNGPIVFLSEQLQPGNIVRRGERLLQVEESAFEMQVAEARSRLAVARLQWLKEDQEAQAAQAHWQQAGMPDEPASPLVLRKPYLASARGQVEAAQKALIHAENLLAHTEICAPFDAAILRRHANPGETLFAGTDVATLYALHIVEVAVHLDARQWALLPDRLTEIEATLVDPLQETRWPARAVRRGRHLNTESRLRTLYLQVTQPLEQTTPLLPGTFVRVHLKGRDISALLRVPEAALTKQGAIWYVDDANQLMAHPAEPVFYGTGTVYVRPPRELSSPYRVALLPNAGFVGGLTVRPVDVKGGE